MGGTVPDAGTTSAELQGQIDHLRASNAELLARSEEMRAGNDALLARVEALEAGHRRATVSDDAVDHATSAGHPQHARSAELSAEHGRDTGRFGEAAPEAGAELVTRRRLIRASGGAAAAGLGLALAGEVLRPDAAQAASNDPVIAGQYVDAGSPTGITSGTAGTTLMVLHTGSGRAINGASGVGNAITGNASSGVAVVGQSNSGMGVTGFSQQTTGVRGQTAGGGIGVEGSSSSGVGVRGLSGGSGIGVQGRSPTGIGVRGQTDGGGVGVEGIATTGVAVRGQADSGGVGVDGYSPTGFGGTFVSNRAQLLLNTSGTRQAPNLDTTQHVEGELIRDSAGDLWLCVVGGTPGTFRKLAGPNTAGALRVFDAPLRAYDSRFGTQPVNGVKAKLVANAPRTILVIVPEEQSTAVLINVLLVNATAGNGNFTVWSAGVARPLANTMVWGGNAGRFSTLAVSGVSNGNVQVQASLGTDLVIDVVGFYR